MRTNTFMPAAAALALTMAMPAAALATQQDGAAPQTQAAPQDPVSAQEAPPQDTPQQDATPTQDMPQQDATPTQDISPQGTPESEADTRTHAERVDETVAELLMDALRVRGKLQRVEGDGAARGERLWASASDLAAVVKSARPADQRAFLPIVDGLRTTMAEAAIKPAVPDLAAIEELQKSLEEQVELQTAPGLAPSARRRTRINVRAVRAGQPVNGLYVWIDIACCVRPDASAFPLPQATSSALADVIPGTYVVRLRRGDTTVRSRKVLIAKSGGTEPVDVVMD